MSKHKYTNLVCMLGIVVMLLLTVLYLCGGAFFLKAAALELPYINKLFSTDKVHRIDLVAKESDWEAMLENALSEEYISCTAVIDGEKFSNVGIRPKGNSSLNTVASSESDRYSFKLEFDHYDSHSTYHGLDKLCLNNAIQDNTYMKDFLCYQMMNFLGADAPLSSFVWITVNGEDCGLFTAVEGIEDAFAQRSYGRAHGQLYKPDSLDMGGGGRGAEAGERKEAALPEGEEGTLPEDSDLGAQRFAAMGGKGGPGGRNGSDDVLLIYSDDDSESYPNIFDNAVFDSVTEADKARLIQAIKALNEGDLESCLQIDEVLRYFAVHNFVLNEDSYTGTMIHNYYLYEENGLLSMVAWDYNLAFGGMGGGMGTESSTAAINSPIDSPVSSGELAERPMVSWIFEQEAYTEQYHQVMAELISGFFTSGVFSDLMENTIALISPYVEKDPTAFCTYEEFQKGVETLREFCLLRAQSVEKQLSGEIPSTSEEQTEAGESLIDGSDLSLSAMGSQGGMGRQRMENEKTNRQTDTAAAAENLDQTAESEVTDIPQKQESPDRSGETPGFAAEGTPPDSGEGNGMPADGQPLQGSPPDGEPGEVPPQQPDSSHEAVSGETDSETGSEQAGESDPANPTVPSGDETFSPGTRPDSPFGNRGFPGMPEGVSAQEGMPAEGSANGLETALLLGGSALLLILGLIFAKRYR